MGGDRLRCNQPRHHLLHELAAARGCRRPLRPGHRIQSAPGRPRRYAPAAPRPADWRRGHAVGRPERRGGGLRSPLHHRRQPRRRPRPRHRHPRGPLRRRSTVLGRSRAITAERVHRIRMTWGPLPGLPFPCPTRLIPAHPLRPSPAPPPPHHPIHPSCSSEPSCSTASPVPTTSPAAPVPATPERQALRHRSTRHPCRRVSNTPDGMKPADRFSKAKFHVVFDGRSRMRRSDARGRGVVDPPATARRRA